MNHLQKHFSARLIALAALLAAPMATWAATAPDLGTAASFAVLGAGSANPPSTAPDATTAVTTTGSTSLITINGNVGSAGAVTLTSSAITGNVVLSGALTNTGSTMSGTSTPLPVQVINDFNTAYTAIQSNTTNPCTQTFTEDAPGAGNTFTGQALSINPGVICFHTSATFTDSTLTLTGGPNDVWIFKVGIDGTGALTGTNFTVIMANGGDSCNVSWWVAQGATMSTSAFQGDILAGAGITLTGLAGTPTQFNGDIMAKAGITVTDYNVLGCNASGGGNGNHCDKGHHYGQYKDHKKCNQGVGNGPEDCDPGNSNMHNPWGSNDENGGKPGDPGRKGGNN